MPDPKPSRQLSEIGHLFLSSVRQRQTNGAPMPRRQPPAARPPEAIAPAPAPITPPMPGPGKRDLSIDLTPEEFAQVYGEGETTDTPQQPWHATAGSARDAEEIVEPEVRIPPVTAVIASHLNGKQFDRVKEYARHLAAEGQRVGLIEVDASEFRIMCFDCPPQGGGSAEDESTTDFFDAGAMTAAIDELSWDLDRWLLIVSNPRTCESRDLLRSVDHWVLLSTCDHDGVVSCYRNLKGLSDLHRPKLSLALLDARSEPEAARIQRKVAGVASQFLAWPLEAESSVRPAEGVAEYLVMCCRPTRDKAQLAMAPQWRVVSDFLTRARAQAEQSQLSKRAEPPPTFEEPLQTGIPMDLKAPTMQMPLPDPRPVASMPEGPFPMPGMAPAPLRAATESGTDDVIELGEGETGAGAILAAVLRSVQGQLIECPVMPPMCAEAKLAVTRDRQLVLLAVARPGLAELRAIGNAYRWAAENIALIGMALPQLSIDLRQAPRLRLLVDHADLAAAALEPMLRSGVVEMQAYRRVRWGGKTGLLLDAA